MINESIDIRPVQEGDYAAWLVLWEAYQEFYRSQLPTEVARETWRRFLDPNEPVYAGVATQGGRLIGMVNLVFHRSTWAVEDYCYLEDLFVAPEMRGKLVGKLLIEWVQGIARMKNCARLYWHTQETNKKAQRLYDWIGEKPGFIEYRMQL